MSERVVITGVGVVAPNGIGKEAYWQALTNGLSGVRSIRRFDSTSLETRIAGEVVDLDPLAYFEAHEFKKVDRSNVLAMAAGLMAVEDAGIKAGSVDSERFGSSIGNAVCGIEFAQKESEVIYSKGPRWGSPYLAIAFFPCGSNGLLSIRLGMKGPVLTFCNGNTSGSDAIGMAYRMLRSGKADLMLAGGAEAPLIPLFVGSMSRDGWLTQNNDNPERASCPFDDRASGMVLGEGAGMLMLETESHARRRGATIYAELAGYSSVNSAYDIFHPEPNGFGIERTMKEVLKESDIRPGEVGWINAQGFSIVEFDAMERRCMADIFGQGTGSPWVSAISSWIGNPIGALGGLQAVASVLSLARQTIPAHNGTARRESMHAVRLAGPTGFTSDFSCVVQNSFCFMGKNSSLVFRRAS